MENYLPILFAAVIGFTHAFEVDHLLAVSSIVTRRDSVMQSVKDGIFWGLGHSSTILAIGVLMLIARVAIEEKTFGWFEAAVGLMLVVLGIHRLWKSWKQTRAHRHAHAHNVLHGHRLAYGVGLVHGLAGSGALILLVLQEMKSSSEGLAYLLVFGVGSIAGMMLASGVFSLPFSQKITGNLHLQRGLTVLSSLLCIGFGLKVIWENLAA